jgi:flotillin
MAKTGPFVKGVHVSRKTFQLPFQKIKVIKMDPINYHFLGSNMSKELVPFKLPLTFTVSPRHPEIDLPGFIKYATRLGDMDHEGVKTIIAGIVHGETRGFVASMTIPEIFSDKEAFKQHVVDRVQKDLDQFGLEIHNANIEEMHDTDGNSYFENLKKKALEGANTRSRIDVSEARKEGDIGEKNREVDTRKQRAILEADAKQTETQQNQKMSDYNRDLTITMTTNKQQEDMVRIDAYKTTESRKIEVESDLNKQKQLQELEKLRSEQVIKATAEAEAVIKKAEADAAATKIKADASLYAKTKEAESVRLLLEAQANGLSRIYDASKTNPQLAHFYLALEKGMFNPNGLFSVIADKQAQAIRGLEPKINIWNTGGSQQSSNNYSDIISGLAKTFPPILDAVQQQTNIKLPDWMATHPQQTQENTDKKN